MSKYIVYSNKSTLYINNIKDVTLAQIKLKICVDIILISLPHIVIADELEEIIQIWNVSGHLLHTINIFPLWMCINNKRLLCSDLHSLRQWNLLTMKSELIINDTFHCLHTVDNNIVYYSLDDECIKIIDSNNHLVKMIDIDRMNLLHTFDMKLFLFSSDNYVALFDINDPLIRIVDMCTNVVELKISNEMIVIRQVDNIRVYSLDCIPLYCFSTEYMGVMCYFDIRNVIFHNLTYDVKSQMFKSMFNVHSIDGVLYDSIRLNHQIQDGCIL